jgi:[ribosomal protein S18]-alanine N-acetyltransferase
MTGAIKLRPGGPADLDEIRAIQERSPEAARWKAEDYLAYQVLVAVDEVAADTTTVVAGFLVWREAGPGEAEILNLAVAPGYRRRGIATMLLNAVILQGPGVFYLEVRESNRAALEFYAKLGFESVGKRPKYYYDPPEAAVVMKFFS